MVVFCFPPHESMLQMFRLNCFSDSLTENVRRCPVLALVLGWGFLSAGLDLGADELTFENDIRPILRANCLDCHGATDDKEGQLDLRQVRLMKIGGESGEAIVEGDSTNSLLLEKVVSGEMPPGDHQLSPEDVETLRNWIDAGAKTARAELETIPSGLGITEEERAYWAFVPIQRPRLPSVKSPGRVRNPVDAFLLARMEPKGLGFGEDAGKAKLIRRAYLDLVGLPPSPGQVNDFLADPSPEAWNQVIENLLASKHYGERWGRHWLDVAGYADSEGSDEKDAIRPWAYKYRDWVIQALNEDMPFDQFIQWQIAGDELVEWPVENLSQSEISKLTATGFLRMASDGTVRANNEEKRNAVVTDTIEIVSSTLLGLSVKCAQCHDHRYDPISHQDYYRLRAVFEPVLNFKDWRVPNARLISLYTDADHAKAAEIEKEAVAKTAEKNKKQAEYMALALESVLENVAKEVRESLRSAYQTPANQRTAAQKNLLKKHPNVASFSAGVLYQYNQAHADQLKAMDADIAKIRSRKPVHEYLRSVAEFKSKTVPKTLLFHRGDYRQPKYEVKPGGLQVCAPQESPFEIAEADPGLLTTGRRLAYAKWLTSGRHPLVARVLVNRFWLHHFGKGLVSTPEEFGKLGTKPTHPKLLDWLADEFMAKGWSLKHLHRLILKSTAYQQASVRTARANEIDQENNLYSYFPVQRLEAEVIRDSVLAMGNRLDRETQFGKPVSTQSDDSGQIVVAGVRQRRSIYLQVRRSQPVSMLEAFDAPVMKVNCASRVDSTAASQSLLLMNSAFVLESAKAFAKRLNDEASLLPGQSLDPSIDEWAPKYEFQSPWHYGYGGVQRSQDSQKDTVVFTPYPVFVEGSWRGGSALPDAKLGWTYVNAGGGHPDQKQGATIRRWTSPVKGQIRISGRLVHHSENGDGVKLLVVSSRQGTVKTEVAKTGGKDYQVTLAVQVGEVIDTVVAAGASHESDTFANAFRIESLQGQQVLQTWDSKADFKGTLEARYLKSPLSKQIMYAWQLAYGRNPSREECQVANRYLAEQLELLKQQKVKSPLEQAMINFCQSILGSNEFLYVD
ncbi:MAG: PSD1 and planctomycete cytochrome C domain-containing protein [Planctomycetota bacterium]|nr:PSD1 and planctomycete cytochrome C domain-containing protein [Planctomycetota bacterium]